MPPRLVLDYFSFRRTDQQQHERAGRDELNWKKNVTASSTTTGAALAMEMALSCSTTLKPRRPRIIRLPGGRKIEIKFQVRRDLEQRQCRISSRFAFMSNEIQRKANYLPKPVPVYVPNYNSIRYFTSLLAFWASSSVLTTIVERNWDETNRRMSINMLRKLNLN